MLPSIVCLWNLQAFWILYVLELDLSLMTIFPSVSNEFSFDLISSFALIQKMSRKSGHINPEHSLLRRWLRGIDTWLPGQIAGIHFTCIVVSNFTVVLCVGRLRKGRRDNPSIEALKTQKSFTLAADDNLILMLQTKRIVNVEWSLYILTVIFENNVRAVLPFRIHRHFSSCVRRRNCLWWC